MSSHREGSRNAQVFLQKLPASQLAGLDPAGLERLLESNGIVLEERQDLQHFYEEFVVAKGHDSTT
jgi:hypothetical protein